MNAAADAPIGAGDLLFHLRDLGCRIWLTDRDGRRVVWCMPTCVAGMAAMRVHHDDIVRNRERLILLLTSEQAGRN